MLSLTTAATSSPLTSNITAPVDYHHHIIKTTPPTSGKTLLPEVDLMLTLLI
jgi:hypothetical protein